MSDENIVSDRLKKSQDKVNLVYQKHSDILNKKFEVLYDKVGLDWTESDKEDIETFLNSLLLKAKIDSYAMTADLINTILTDDEIMDLLIK